MAKAPKPRSENEHDGNTTITITVKGESYRLNSPGNLPFGERAAVRRATGLPLEAFFPTEDLESHVFGLDSLQVLWWLARRGTNPMLTLTKALEDWPDDLGPDDIDMSMDAPDDEDADPES